MTEREKLISMGEKIISNFQEKLNQGGELVTWRKEALLSCEILLSYLKASPIDVEKTIFLANVFRERYEISKPPVIPHWCRIISEYLLSHQ
ncbi:hypothetical protein [Sessilibacter corallicola]|uniref:Uncharacterized protein n=1 Tax=Sessilibacter corallicola TaxID=2904075 RepID=A0ABQ0A8K3_9GAMM